MPEKNMRVLFISMFYPPLNSIACLRVKPMVDKLLQNGIEVDIITKHYDADQINSSADMVSILDSKDASEPYLQGNILFIPFKLEGPQFKKYTILPSPFNGLYNYMTPDLFHENFINWSVNGFKKYFSGNKYNLIIASFGPPAAIMVAKKISEQYQIPFIVDFRDAYITEKHSGLRKLILMQMQNYLLEKSSGLVFASEGMRDYFFSNSFKKVKNKDFEVVYNGAVDSCFSRVEGYDFSDQNVIESYQRIKQNYDLVLIHTGTIYKDQDIRFFLDGILNLSDIKVGIVLLGLTSNTSIDPFKYPDVHVLPKVKHKTSIYLQQESDALLLPVYKNRYTGWSGKTFEYLASGKIILCSPEPQNDLLPFFNDNNNVVVLKDREDLRNNIQLLYSKSLKSGPFNEERIRKDYWLELFVKFIIKKAS
jgi:glycosyltransferase involved in cell wall biosynthesis